MGEFKRLHTALAEFVRLGGEIPGYSKKEEDVPTEQNTDNTKPAQEEIDGANG